MLNNSTHTFQVQTVSYERYLQDMWIAAFVFVLFFNETTISLPFLWISIQFLIMLVTNYCFTRLGPNLFLSIITPLVALLFLFLFGASLWLYCLSVLFSIWSLHNRYNVVQFDENRDSPFPLISLITFFSIHLLCFLLGMENYKLSLYSVFLGGVVFFIGSRLFSVWKKSHTHSKRSFLQVMLFYVSGLLGIGFFVFILYLLFGASRHLLTVFLGWLFTLVMIPLTPLLILVEKFLSRIAIEPIEERDQEIETNDTTMDKILPDQSEVITNSFSIEWILFSLLGIAILFIVIYLIRKKIEHPVEEKNTDIIFTNNLLVKKEEGFTTPSTLYKVESSFLRELYIDFEKEADSLGYKREISETVREWFKRMSWKVEDKFFSIYEEVRYGGQMIDKEKAEVFIKELEKIKIFFEKEV